MDNGSWDLHLFELINVISRFPLVFTFRNSGLTNNINQWFPLKASFVDLNVIPNRKNRL